MAQTPCIKVQAGEVIPDPSTTTRTGGDVVVLGTVPLVCLPTDPNLPGSNTLDTEGVYDVPKDSSTFTVGDSVYWSASGNPVTGTAGTGAATSTPSANLMGLAIADAATGDSYVRVKLTAAKRTSTLAGSVTADDISGSDASLGIAGLAAAQGGAVVVTGGTSSTGGNAGGAVSLVGGTPGVTGAGGAVAVAGGAGGSTSGTGGAVTIAGGAGTAGNANGGALTINGGAKHGSGTDGAITIGSTAASITMGKMPRIPTATVAAAGSVQGDAAAVAEGFTLVSAADATKGVVLPSAVAGMQVIIKNGAAAVLKIWPASSDAINALSANASFSIAANTSVHLIAYDATTWYSIPLLPS